MHPGPHSHCVCRLGPHHRRTTAVHQRSPPPRPLACVRPRSSTSTAGQGGRDPPRLAERRTPSCVALQCRHARRGHTVPLHGGTKIHKITDTKDLRQKGGLPQHQQHEQQPSCTPRQATKLLRVRSEPVSESSSVDTGTCISTTSPCALPLSEFCTTPGGGNTVCERRSAQSGVGRGCKGHACQPGTTPEQHGGVHLFQPRCAVHGRRGRKLTPWQYGTATACVTPTQPHDR